MFNNCLSQLQTQAYLRLTINLPVKQSTRIAAATEVRKPSISEGKVSCDQNYFGSPLLNNFLLILIEIGRKTGLLQTGQMSAF